MMQENTLSKRYKLIQKLGEGGMGVVYHAHDRLTGTDVALKQVNTNPANLLTNSYAQNPSDDPRLSLAHEFQMMASLRHPNVIGVQDYGFGRDGQPFFTMTLLENAQNLAQASLNQPLNTKINFAMQILQALSYIHRRDILHRDLKPSNVLVKNGRVYVVDFGLAETQDTQQTGVAGTLSYMSPEVLMGESPSQSSDLFALGIMLYEMLAGSHPFVGKNVAETIAAILEKDPDWLALDVTIDLLWVMQKLLEKSPQDRYQTATEVMTALSKAIGVPLPPETSDIRESFLQAAQFIGRDKELLQLVLGLKQIVAASKSPNRADTAQAIGARWLIGGESGVGKSRLVEEIRVRAMVQGVMVVRGGAVSDGGMPYHLWRDLLRRMILNVDMPETSLSVLKEIIPDLSTLLDRPIPDFPEANDPATFQKRLFASVEEVFRLTLAQTPVLLIAEDLQWATESVTLLKEISQLAFDLPLLVIGVYRDDERPNLPNEMPNFQVMNLKRLSTDEIARLSHSILGDIGERPQVVDLLERETEGNVFFLVEVVRALAEDAGSLADIGRETLPSQIFSGGIRRIVSHRLERVGEWARDLLNGAAVAGRRIDPKVISALSPTTNIELWLSECVNTSILSVSEEAYQFAHDKLREGILELLSDEQTHRLNGLVGDAIETVYADSIANFAGSLAQHYHKAGNLQKEAKYAIIAAEQAQEAYNHADAKRLYLRLLDIHAEQYEPNPTQYLARVYLGIGRACYGVSDYGGVRDWQTKALAMAKQADDVFLIGEAEFAIGEVDMRQGMYETALSLTHASKEKYQQAGNTKKVAYALMSIGMIQTRMGLVDEGTKTTEECLMMMRDIGDEVAIARAMNNYAICHDMVGKWERALELYNESLDMRRRINDRSGISYSLVNIGALLKDMGRYDESLIYLLDARKVMLPIGEKLSIATCYASIGDVYLELKQYDEARHWMMESQKIRLEIQDKAGLAYNYKIFVQLELALGDVPVAKAWHNQLLALITPDYSPLFIQIDALFVAYLIFNYEGDYEKALMLVAVVYNDRVKRNPNVEGLDKRIAELREKLGERYDAIRAQADQETVTSMIEKLQNEFKFIV